MLYRKYPRRIKGTDQIVKPTTIRFSPTAKNELKAIHDMLVARWGLEHRLSRSLMLEGMIVLCADAMRQFPTAITGLIHEIEARGGVAPGVGQETTR